MVSKRRPLYAGNHPHQVIHQKEEETPMRDLRVIRVPFVEESLMLLIARSEDVPPIEVEATFHSGFDKDLSVAPDLAEYLGLPCLGFLVDEIDGNWTPRHILAEATVGFADQEKTVPVVVSDAFGRVVIGSHFLERFKVNLIVGNQAPTFEDSTFDCSSLREEQANGGSDELVSARLR